MSKNIIADSSSRNLIKDGDNILIYGKSKIFRKILLKAHQQGINFEVIFVDTPKSNQISTEIEFLAKLGISVTYSYLNGVSGLIGGVTKVFVKGKSMLSNGNLQGKLGTALLSTIAYNSKKPVIAFCQTFKFWDKIMLHNFHCYNFNETLSKDKNSTNNGFSQLVLDYDITPARYINMVICEVGNIPATSVPVIIREFNQQEIEADYLMGENLDNGDNNESYNI